MVELLQSDWKKIDILNVLSDNKIHSFYDLSKNLGSNFITVKVNCNFLEILGFIEVYKIEKEESASGKASYSVKITEKGLKWLKKMKKQGS